MIDWTHVMGAHLPQIIVVGILVLLAQLVHQVVTSLGLQNVEWTMGTVRTVAAEIQLLFVQLYNNVLESHGLASDLFSPAVKTTALLLLVSFWWLQRQKPVYLLSYATFKAPTSWKLSHDDIIEIMRRQRCFTEDSLGFLQKILERSGTGPATAWPPGIVQCLKDGTAKADRSIEASRKEAESVIFDVVEKALEKANVKPRDIDILIINCSLFSPTPSLCVRWSCPTLACGATS
jgi:3-ketoacyl-CoA synthase